MRSCIILPLMFVIGIESTCDETACSIVKDGCEILSNVVSSQVDLHALYGGVYPELAARRHLDVLLPVIREALLQAELSPSDLDLIAVARGPGLIGPLLIGLNAAKALALGWNLPYIGVNHVEAHLYAAMMHHPAPAFPALGLVLSGGHSFLVKITALGTYHLLGTTVDDALGEAYDKVASLLNLSYPGGPALEQLARTGDPTRYPFKPGCVKNHPLDFSFSGIKTNVLYTLKGQSCSKDAPITLPAAEYPHIAASFQEAVLHDVVHKAHQAATTFPCHALYVGGGVSNNRRLRTLLQDLPFPIHFPPPGLSLDNAAMIAGLGYHTFKQEGPSPLELEPLPRIPLPS